MNPQDNPLFTAYVLGELSAEEAASVHASLAQVPASGHELEQIEAVTDALQRFRNVCVGKLTHIFGSDNIYHLRGIALDFRSLFKRASDTRYNDNALIAICRGIGSLGILRKDSFGSDQRPAQQQCNFEA